MTWWPPRSVSARCSYALVTLRYCCCQSSILLWYAVEGDNKIRQAPDAMVAFGRPKGYRGSYRQWEEGGIAPQVVGRFREGDIRTCYADIARARERLGYAPRVTLERGVGGLAAWAASQRSVDRGQQALEELTRHGLVR